MSDIHPLSGSSYDEMAQNNPLDVKNHPDNNLGSFKGAGYSSYDANTNTFWGDNKDGSISPMSTSVGNPGLESTYTKQRNFGRALRNMK